MLCRWFAYTILMFWDWCSWMINGLFGCIALTQNRCGIENMTGNLHIIMTLVIVINVKANFAGNHWWWIQKITLKVKIITCRKTRYLICRPNSEVHNINICIYILHYLVLVDRVTDMFIVHVFFTFWFTKDMLLWIDGLLHFLE